MIPCNRQNSSESKDRRTPAHHHHDTHTHNPPTGNNLPRRSLTSTSQPHNPQHLPMVLGNRLHPDPRSSPRHTTAVPLPALHHRILDLDPCILPHPHPNHRNLSTCNSERNYPPHPPANQRHPLRKHPASRQRSYRHNFLGIHLSLHSERSIYERWILPLTAHPRSTRTPNNPGQHHTPNHRICTYIPGTNLHGIPPHLPLQLNTHSHGQKK